MYYLFGIIYPLFRSSRIARGKECEENKLKILKYWSVFCIVQLLTYYLQSVLSYLDVGKLAISIIHATLVIFDFKLSEIVYDNIIQEFFGRNEVLLHELFKYLRKALESTVYKWFEGARDIMFAFLAAIIPRLPSAIKTPLEFIGITKFLDARLDKYKNFERKKQQDKELLEYAKEIEKNRPESPMKSANIELKTPGKDEKSGKESFIDGEKKDQYIYDPATKQFKMVTKTYDSSSKQFVTASPPTVIGTKKVE